MAYYKDLPIWRDAAAHLICQEVAHAALWAPLRQQTLQRPVERIEALKISVHSFNGSVSCRCWSGVSVGDG